MSLNGHMEALVKNNNRKLIWDFPGSPGVKTSHFHCRVGGFDPWSGN